MNRPSTSRSTNPSENHSHNRRVGNSNTATGSTAQSKTRNSTKRILDVELKRLEMVDRNPNVPPEVRQISTMLMYGLPMALAVISGGTKNTNLGIGGAITGGIVVFLQISTAWSRYKNDQNQASYQTAKHQVNAILTIAAKSAANKICQDIREQLPIASKKRT